MGRYLCVEAGLRSAGHEVVELLVQYIQAEDLTIVWSNGKVLVCRSRFKKRRPRDGGHELKEKEVGDDPDSQIQQKSWPVSQNAKGINLVPCCSQEVFFPHHLSKTRGRLEPLCGAMGRYLCVEAGLRSASHEVVELLVQVIQAEYLTIVWSNGKVLVCRSRFKKRRPRAWISPILGLKLAVGIQMSNLKSQNSRHVSSLSLQENDKIKPIANILWRSPQPAPKRVERML
ncbi:hypothetical protein F2Q69_00042118 [Brassica cretica]|uniref:Uncharacterized protein n=1 Tax=Brassica cretica TaxID=69181 RepID=A0A8S9NEM6_BRACR|nr:hypothetical protein F2Q69_00042118 [Brassica cretica]